MLNLNTGKAKNMINSLLAKYFGKLEVVDAKVSLTLLPTREDFEGAVPRDPKNCGLSRCTHRMLHSSATIFLGRNAYVDFPDTDGVIRVHRYETSYGGAREQLEPFDEFDGDISKVPLGRSVILFPPSKKRTLIAMRQTNKRWRRKTVGRAIRVETMARDRLATVTRDAERAKEKVKVTKPRSKEQGEARAVLRTSRSEIRLAREMYQQAKKTADSARSYKFRKSPRKKLGLKKHWLSVRNGTGFFGKGVKIA